MQNPKDIQTTEPSRRFKGRGSDDIFSASSSALFGSSEKSIVAEVKDGQLVVAPADNPAQELVRTSIGSAYERISVAAALTRKHLDEIYKQHRAEAQNWFRVSIIASFLGFLVVLAGIIATFAGYTTAGIASATGGTISEIIAALFYQQARLANLQLRDDQLKLTDAEKIYQAVELVQTINEPALCDQLKVSIIKLALRDIAP